MGRQTRSSAAAYIAAAPSPAEDCIGTRTRSCGNRKAPTDTPGPKARSAPAKPHHSKNRKKFRSANRKAKLLEWYTLEGEEYRVGDAVYLALENFADEEEDDTSERCQICSKNPRNTFILECSSCLRGYHGKCVNPPLKDVPQGDWLCPNCNAGRVPPPPNPPRTAVQMVLYGNEMMALAKIESMIENRNGQGEVEVVVHYYCTPDKTHLGRQKPFRAREMYLVKGTFWEPVECIYRKATVCTSAEFAETGGDDVFLCDFVYDPKWKRFTRLGQEQADGNNSDMDWGASDGEEDMTYNPAKDTHLDSVRKGKQLGQFRKQGQVAALMQLQSQLPPGQQPTPAAAPACPFATAKATLAAGAVPAELPCRDEEKGIIKRFISDAVRGRSSSNVLYICGVPGTGKTASVIEVIFHMRQQLQEAGVQFVALNGLQLPSPQHVYSKLWERISGQQASPARALSLLEQQFSGARPSGGASNVAPTLVVVDEVDVLMTKDQAVLYNLFEWPTRSGSKLCVVAVSNTHDLDERVLPRIASRLAASKLVFKPYNVDQLGAIVRQRLEGHAVVLPAAMQFAAQKVSSDSGDARRVLELMRRAVEVAEAESKSGTSAGRTTGNVAVRHVNEAVKEMYNSIHMQYLRSCSPLEKLLLVGITQETRAISRSECTLQGAAKRIPLYCQIIGKPEPVLASTIPAAWRMSAKRLILAGPTAQHLKVKVALNVQAEDIAQVIKADPSLRQLASFL